MQKESKQKILILKTGYSEFLDQETNTRKVSLGDILRTTVLLHPFKDQTVYWVTDEVGIPLLKGNPYITKILPYDFTTVLQLEAEIFDTVINLEKIPGICALVDKIDAWQKHGFRFDKSTGKSEAYERAAEVLAVCSDQTLKKENSKYAQELMYEVIGKKWNNEKYILGYNPKSEVINDVGLNILVGEKWPNKQWNLNKWNELEDMLTKEGYKVTRQDKQNKEVLNNLYSYMDWINSSKALVSNDSLGLHLAIALNKPAIGLFGPTPSSEICFYGKGKAITARDYDCIPCFKSKCTYTPHITSCMDFISPEQVFEETKKLLKC
ncbi:glycosyltransferase family 9 protein [Candidatus Woesearchaeota archaeon]|nr:glycosyltransferase family 9 protein [Candidatus Woesearchaeota archaeon]